MKMRFFLKIFPLALLLFSLLISSCDPDDPKPTTCDISNVSFSQTILPILEQSCRTGCHNGTSPSSGFALETYADVKVKVDEGRLAGAVAQEAGFAAMPFNMDALPTCDVDQIKAWIDQGALDN